MDLLEIRRWGLALLLLAVSAPPASPYLVGVGIADITGPPAEVPFMGYANPEQRGHGLHLRQFARSFIVVDGDTRLVFVTADCGMMGTFLRKEVLKRLQETFGEERYTVDNVMISGTHTHSTPGGFLMDIIFDLNSWGFVPQTFEAYAAGITRSIIRAHQGLKEGWIELGRGDVLDASINRSPTAYLENPSQERARYQYDVDKTFTQLKFYAKSGDPMGVLTWFAVHPTSMNNTNELVSSDNVGLASILLEKRLNRDLPLGKGPFVAGFASTNLGDVSPNIRGPRCVPSGAPCDLNTSSCADHKDKCISFGPGEDMFQSTHIIATRMADRAWEAWKRSGQVLEGPLSVVHQYVDMPSQKVTYTHPNGSLSQAKGCLAAMGYSFAAGTTDGPGMFSFKQGTKTTNPLWNAVTNLLAPPTPEQIKCQAPKPILLATGQMDFPFEWQPAIVSTQLARLGSVAIACVPGEFTTMSGRRMRTNLASHLPGVPPDNVIIAGLCNTYSDYVTTPEEYQVQRYEGASTIYGPHTLTIYLAQYKKLAHHITNGSRPATGPEPPDYRKHVVSLLPPVIFDGAGWNREFGQVLQQPPPQARPGETVSVLFVSGHPRNGLQTEGTYLKVERASEAPGGWHLVATDADWETKLVWRRVSSLMGTSTVQVLWEVPQGTPPGLYRIRHFGHHKSIFEGVLPYSGTSASFSVVS